MSDSTNPFQSPEADINSIKPMLNSGVITETMINHLKAAAPWLRFAGILSYISCGFMVFFGLIIFILPSLMISFSDVFAGGIGMVGGLFYMMFAVICFFPAKFIYSFGSKIRSYVRTNVETDLEEAFRYNKSFWKFVGIMLVISLAFMPVSIIIGIIAAVNAAAF